MNKPTLAGVHARLDRVREQVPEVRRMCDAIVGHSQQTALNIHQTPGRLTVSMDLPTRFSPKLSVLLGEAFHNLRSALDHLAWQLVLANGGTPDHRTEFPIFLDAGRFASEAPRKMNGMSRRAEQTIEALQPYNAWPTKPDGTTLWQLHQLSNIDKHRIAHQICFWLGSLKAELDLPPGVDGRIVEGMHQGLLRDGDTLLRIEWSPLQMTLLPNPRTAFDVDMSFDVAIHSPEAAFLTAAARQSEAMPVGHALQLILDHFDQEILPQLGPEIEAAAQK